MVNIIDVIGGRLHRKIERLEIPKFGILLLHIFAGATNFFSCGAIGTVVYVATKEDKLSTRYTRLRNDEEHIPIISVWKEEEEQKVKEIKPPKEEHHIPTMSELLNHKQIQKVDHVFRELLTTEQTYVSDLESLEYWYIRPILKSHPPILPVQNCLHSCFKKLTTITKMNGMFLKDLENIISLENSNVPQFEPLCRTIIMFSQPFKLYVEYISDYEVYEKEMIRSLKKNKRFLQVCKIAREELKARKSRMNELQSFSITPIQRIPRILLMMKELGKYVMEGSKEYQIFMEAMNIISETAAYCNKKTKEIRNLKKLRDVQTRYDLKGLIMPHTKILAEGEVYRVRRSGKGLRSNIIILNDLLVCSPLKKPKDLTWFKKPYVVKLNDDEENTRVEKVEEKDIMIYHIRGKSNKNKNKKKKKNKKTKCLWLRFDDTEEREKYFELVVDATSKKSDE